LLKTGPPSTPLRERNREAQGASISALESSLTLAERNRETRRTFISAIKPSLTLAERTCDERSRISRSQLIIPYQTLTDDNPQLPY